MTIRSLLPLLLLLTLPPAPAQPLRDGNGPRERPGRPEHAGPDRDRPDQDRRQPVVERWLNHLQKQNPEEHRRLTALRREDPAAFRAEMRQQLAEIREKRSLNGDGPGAPPNLKPAIEALRAAETEPERTRALEHLRTALAEHIDQRLAAREQRIQSIREELERLETRHRADQARRDTWIQETLEQILKE